MFDNRQKITQTAQEPANGIYIFALALRSFLIMFVNALSMLVFPLYFISLGYSISHTGVLIAISNLTSMMVSIIAGMAIERADRRRVLLVGSMLLSVIYVAYIFVATDQGISLLRLLQGLVTPLASVAGLVMIADVGASERGRVAGIVNQWGSIGMILGPAVGGVVMSIAGVKGTFGLSGVAILLGALPIYFLLPSYKHRQEQLGENQAISLLKANPLVYLLGGVNLLDFVGFQSWVFLMAIALQARGVSESMIGTMMTIQSITYTMVQGICGKLADAGKGMYAVAIGMFFYGVAVYSIPFVPAPWVLAILMLILGIISAPTFTSVFVEISREAKDATSSAMGLLNASTSLGNALGPLLGGVLAGGSMVMGFGATLAVFWTNAVLAALYIKFNLRNNSRCRILDRN